MSRRTVAQGNSMKSELIILRGLYAMTALVVVFGICALLLRAH
jgi:membrane glycosyltransferase